MSKHRSMAKLVARVRGERRVGRLGRPAAQLTFPAAFVVVVLGVVSATRCGATPRPVVAGRVPGFDGGQPSSAGRSSILASPVGTVPTRATAAFERLQVENHVARFGGSVLDALQRVEDLLL
jgi:hypothetical protein